MKLTAAVLRKFAEKGMTLEDVIDLAETWEAGEVQPVPDLSKGALRTRKWRANKDAASRGDVTETVTVTRHGDVSHVGECAQVVTLTSSLRSEGTQEANASFVDASKPADPEKPKTKPPKATRGTRLPDDWEPSDADVEVARSEGLSDEEIQRAALEFRNYWCSRTRDATKLSWPKTWHNRVIDIADRKRRGGPRLVASSTKSGGNGRGAVSFADIYARRHGYTSD